MTSRYRYAWGYRSRDRATDALEDMFAAGEVSPGEDPRIEPYMTRGKVMRYAITLSA